MIIIIAPGIDDPGNRYSLFPLVNPVEHNIVPNDQLAIFFLQGLYRVVNGVDVWEVDQFFCGFYHFSS